MTGRVNQSKGSPLSTEQRREPFQRCRSRVRMAAAMDDMRFGLHWALRKIRQDFSRATRRSTSACAADSARLTVCCVGVRSRPGGHLRGVRRHMGRHPCRRGRRGSGRSRGSEPQSGRARGRAGRARSTAAVRPGRSPPALSRSDVGVFWEKSAGLSPTRSHSARVPSSMTSWGLLPAGSARARARGRRAGR